MLADLMTTEPVTVRPNDSLQRAAQLMDEFNVGALPVCHGVRLVGLITDRDITVRATAIGLNPHLTPVHAVMSSPVRTCTTTQPARDVVALMTSVQIRRVPILDQDQQLVGVVSLGDLAERLRSDINGALRRISNPARPDRSRPVGVSLRQAAETSPQSFLSGVVRIQ